MPGVIVLPITFGTLTNDQPVAASDLDLNFAALNTQFSTSAGGLVPASGGGTSNFLRADGAFAPAGASILTAGFQNKLRNSSQSAWFHGASVSVPTSGAWASEGIYVVPTGATAAAAQVSNPFLFPLALTYFATKITGATSITDVTVRFIVESYDAATMAGQTVTFQVPVQNNTGGSITPTLTVKRATAGQDSYGTTSSDVTAQPLQTLASGAQGILAYAWTVNTAAINGFSIDVDFGNNFGSNAKNIVIGGGFDVRVTPGVATGTISSPPTPEIRDPQSDILWCKRFFRASYINGIAPGTATYAGITYVSTYLVASFDSSATAFFDAPMRATPTIAYWDGAGTASKLSYTSIGGGTTFTDGATNIEPGAFAIGLNGFSFLGLASAQSGVYYIHYTADATITGA
jgi:hypothetical protein